METKSKSEKVNPEMESRKFKEFFVDQLKDIYWAEHALSEALPEMAEDATCGALAKAFQKHKKETEGQIRILEQVFELMGEKAEGKKCEAMAGLIKEAKSIIKDTEKDTFIRDAGLVLAAQKSEHYEIASYGTLVEFAQQMGEPKVAKLLHKILDEEKKTDVSLTMLSEDGVNESAVRE